ncbi:hypothetical protein SAMN05720606_105242, partial [Paenibacillus polysaccharolyticus]
MISKLMEKALKSFNDKKKDIIFNNTKKKQSFNSPAIKMIENIVTKNKYLQLNRTNNRQSNLLKRNKNLNNYVQQIGSLVVSAANQKSYHKGSFSTKNTWEKEEEKSILEKLNELGKDSISSFNSFNSRLAAGYNTVKNGTTSWFSNTYEYSKNGLSSGLKKAGDMYNAAKNGT